MLSNADRERIREEEEERVQVRRQLEHDAFSTSPVKSESDITRPQLLWLLVIGFVVVMLISNFIVRSAIPSGGSAAKNEPASDSAAMMAEGFVKQRLKAPSTAEFGSYYKGDENVTSLGNGKFIVIGWVDSQNGFGAKLRTNWTCTLHTSDGDRWSGDSVEINEQ